MSARPSARTLRLVAIGDERGASTRYRVLAPRARLEAEGWRSELRLTPLSGRGLVLRVAGRTLDAFRLLSDGRADVLFVHRRIYPRRLLGLLARSARLLVYDMDDAIDLPPPSRRLRPAGRARYRRRFEQTVAAFDLVLCGNQELASRLPHDRFEILPTPIDTDRFSPSRLRTSKTPTLGWVGHSDNLGYLEALQEPLRELARRHARLRLLVASDRAPRIDGIDVRFRRWTMAGEVATFDGIDVGLMPLDDTPWARGKCAFKAIQFLSLGIPTVASPVGMTPDVVRHGKTGMLARNPAEWFEALDRLLRDRAEARALGAAGRRLVQRDYSVRAVSGRLVSILEEHLGRKGRASR